MPDYINLDKSPISKVNGNHIDLDKFDEVSPLSGLDYHSGYYCIEFGEEITIQENKQMTNWGGLKIDGILNIDGQLIIEA